MTRFRIPARLMPCGAALLALWLALVSGMARADSITGTVDGAPQVWHVLQHEGASSARFEDQGIFTMATILGLADPSDPENLDGALEISLMLRGVPEALTVADRELVYLAGGPGRLYLPSPDGPEPELTLVESRTEGDGLFLSGRITAQVHRVISLATEELDMDDSHLVEAVFAVTLRPG